jgi:hypothetical protein
MKDDVPKGKEKNIKMKLFDIRGGGRRDDETEHNVMFHCGKRKSQAGIVN